ncbi:hypothetical protein GCM10022251_75840 [Phytohabitans flavus]|uniref:Uncharacterized protein n=1 Tax=Phytohabitans flavus TaxID=1076124 RepID=A0A6F8XMK3_9ACTN|nr:hypothetical protein Pflav_014290 [Phytohabitans flavus]
MVPNPARWDYGDWHHAVMGVQLGTDQGPATVTWTDTFFPYGVEVFHAPIENHLALGADAGPEQVGPRADGDSPWAKHLGSQVLGTASHWDRLEMPTPATRHSPTPPNGDALRTRARKGVKVGGPYQQVTSSSSTWPPT